MIITQLHTPGKLYNHLKCKKKRRKRNVVADSETLQKAAQDLGQSCSCRRPQGYPRSSAVLQAFLCCPANVFLPSSLNIQCIKCYVSTAFDATGPRCVIMISVAEQDCTTETVQFYRDRLKGGP